MKNQIEALEKIDFEKGTFQKLGIEPTLWYAYQYSKNTENELVNFSDVIWEKDIKNIVECMKKFGIKEFTISSTFSGLIETIAEFEKEGCKLEGITTIESKYEKDFTTDEEGKLKEIVRKIPAFKMSITTK